MKNKIKKYLPLILPLLLFTLLRIPSLFESYWYTDEGIYAALAQGIYEGKTLYSQVWDHKPPLLYWFYYIAGLGGWESGLFIIRFISLSFGLTSIYLLYKIFKNLDFNNWIILISLTLASVLLGTPIFEGNIANAEVFFILFNIGILYLLLKDKNYILTGILASLSFLIKTPGFLESAVLILTALIILYKEQDLKTVLLKTSKISLGFFLPLLAILLYFYINNGLSPFIQGAFIQSFSYSGELAQPIMLFGWNFAPTFTKALIFAAIYLCLIYLYFKKDINKTYFIILSLLSIEIFASFLSGRNYPHYLIQVIPGTTLLLSLTLSKFQKETKSLNLKYLAIFLMIYQLIITTFTAGKPLNIYAQPWNYYPAFINSEILNTNKEQFWWKNTPDIQRIKNFAQYFNENYKEYENYYLYTKEPWTFALINKPSTNKFVVWYHLTYNPHFMSESKELRQKAELFIVDEETKKVSEFFNELNEYKKIDEQNKFSIYTK